MNKRISLLCLALFSAILVLGKVWTPATLPVINQNTHDSTQVSYVCNPDGILDQAVVDSINEIMFQLNTKKGVRGLVIAVEEIEPDDPYEFTINVFNMYGVGGKKNTGFALMVASKSRGYQIITGRGMEKFLTDVDCSCIGRNFMVPLLKDDKWGAAVLEGVKKIKGVINGEEELTADDAEEAKEEGEGNAWLWILGIFGTIAGGTAFAIRRSRKCPKCKKHNYRLKLRQTILAPGEEGAPDPDEAEKELNAKFYAILLSENENLDMSTVDADVQDMARHLVAAKKATEDEKVPMEAKPKKGIALRRKVRVADLYYCPDCGFVDRKHNLATTDDYELGLFVGGAFGVIAKASNDDSGTHSRHTGGGYSGRSSSRPSGPSYGSFGGGRSDGGGAGGRF